MRNHVARAACPPSEKRVPRTTTRLVTAIAWLALLSPAVSAMAADIDLARAEYQSGEYARAIALCDEAIEAGSWDESWRELLIRAHMAIGQYPEAGRALEAALRQFSTSVRLRLVGIEVLRHNDRVTDADAMLKAIEVLATQAPWRYSDAANRVTLGRSLVLMGADARQVLELFYDRVKSDQPDYVETYVATGDLALEKSDMAVAAEAFEQANQRRPNDPDILCGLARAYADSDSEKATAALAAALGANPRHIESLLVQVDTLVDSESYDEAQELIAEALKINPRHPLAWAYRAVLAHLNGDEADYESHRAKALGSWKTNPVVDHLIGRKLSQKYRFAEGAARQRQALKFDPDYAAAKIQLSQDLLRLGQEEEGWRLADEAHAGDGYNVVAYNLVTLEDAIAKFRTLSDADFTLRMDAREAEIYGHRVLDLLRKAKSELAEKYESTIDEPVIVEIFPQQKDFAVRTFGMPGGDGFLGVCFGRVITANSPASQGDHPSNWEAVLWHEFCHVVTLSKTKNKMPRWLSEGISVYEERERNPAWGQGMTPRYREMVLGDELTPIGQLSGAFLRPKTPGHLQFAYYESSLVVEFLMGRGGLPAMRRLLSDLADDIPINAALERHFGPLDELEPQFAEFARRRAREYGPDVDWQAPTPEDVGTLADVATFNKEHPNNFLGLIRWGQMLIAADRAQEALAPLREAIELVPDESSADGPRGLLAAAHQRLNETEAERAVLEEVASHDDEAVSAYARLMELAREREDWPALAANARRYLAVNPLVALPHRELADAAERMGESREAIAALAVVSRLDPIDPAEVCFRLADLEFRSGDPIAARRHALAALEEAPRYRAAHQLLLRIVREGPIIAPPAGAFAPPNAPPASPSAPTAAIP